MLPGRYDWIGISLSIASFLFNTIILIFFGIVLTAKLNQSMNDTGVSIHSILFDYKTSFDVLQNKYSVFLDIFADSGKEVVSSFLAACLAVGTLIRIIYLNRRERLLKLAFGAGLWYGYVQNFLTKVVSSFSSNNLQTFIILGSPSRDITCQDGQLSPQVLINLINDLKNPLLSRGYLIESVILENPAIGSRQMFSIRSIENVTDGNSHERLSVFFDIPTTLVAFEGAIKEIEDNTGKPIKYDEKELYFDDLRNDFFSCAKTWAVEQDIDLVVIDIKNMNAFNIAEEISKKLDVYIH